MKELLDALSSISSPTRRILRVFFAAVLRRTGNTYNYTYKCRKLQHCRIGIGRRVLVNGELDAKIYGVKIDGAKLDAKIYGVELPAMSLPRLRRAQKLDVSGSRF